MNRKQRRAAAKEEHHEDISEKLAMFQNLPSECSACIRPFDRKDKEMALTWNVVVRDTDTVRLYCPRCWDTAQAVVKHYEQEEE